MASRPRQILSFALSLALGLASAPAEGLKVYSSTLIFGPWELEQDRLRQMPAGYVPVQFEEPVWIVGYSTEIVDAKGEKLSNDLHCHTLLATPIVERWKGHALDGRPFEGLYTDPFTRRIVLPEGFGLFIAGGEHFELQPTFNNRSDRLVSAGMAITAHFVKADDLAEPLTPLFTTVAAVADLDLYTVAPGEDVREHDFRIPYAGTIHGMGVHLHAYGREIELINKSRKNETVWKSVGNVGADGQLIDMPFYSSSEGYRFSPDDRFALRARYFNPTDVEQDAMAGLFIFFATEDGKLP